MTTMREAFEKESEITPTDFYGFEAGWNAAIAAVKEGGAYAWVSDGELCFGKPDAMYGVQPTPLYKLPEDAK